MPICAHKGCEKTYDEEENNDNACLYHPSSPIFHEGKVYFYFDFYRCTLNDFIIYLFYIIGLKGWQYCNRRVSTFDEFLVIPGCTLGYLLQNRIESIWFFNFKLC